MSVNEKNKLPIDVLLNCILVNENVRPAMLVQPADYKEATHEDPKTNAIIEEIKHFFPKLILSTDYDNYQGVIISKNDYNGNKTISLTEMGKILGYPCYEDFSTIDNDKITYIIDIFVNTNQRRQIQIVANRCKDKTKLKKFNTLAEKAKIAFAKKQYKEILNGLEVEDVYVNSFPNIPTQIIINKLLSNEKLEQNELDKIQNILYNLGFSMELEYYFSNNFQYNNPIHKGILLELLLNDKHAILSPFYPLQNYPAQFKKVQELTKLWEKGLLDILEKTATEAPTRAETTLQSKKVHSAKFSSLNRIRESLKALGMGAMATTQHTKKHKKRNGKNTHHRSKH